MRKVARVGISGLAVAITCVAQTLDYRVIQHRSAVEGRLWLYAGGWGWLQRTELGKIEGGILSLPKPESFPQEWPFDADHGYLLALETSDGLWRRSEMLVSPRDPSDAVITRAALAESLPDLIDQLGSLRRDNGDRRRTLALPEPRERRITLLHEDGRPFAGEEIDVDVFVWRENHCGAAMGLGFPVQSYGALGVFRTDESGSFSVRAPQATIVLRREHVPVVASSGDAVLRRRMDAIEVQPGGDVTIRSLWHSPETHPSPKVQVLDLSGAPVAGWYAAWDLNSNTCGPPALIAGPSSNDGWIDLAGPAGGLPLELTRSLAIYDSDVRLEGPWDRRLVRELNQEELFELVRTGSITLRLQMSAR